MGLREIMGATVTVFMIVYILEFVIPAGRTAYNSELSVANTTSTTMQSILPFINNFWTIFPLIIVAAGGYGIYLYATSKLGFDY